MYRYTAVQKKHRMGKPAVVVVVDDETRVLDSLQNLLESAGYAAHGFASAQALLTSRVWETFDLLITDIGMPQIDGFALCRRLQSERPGIPAILITGGKRLLQEADGLGVPVFFKPVDADQLLRSVAENLENAAHDGEE
jgi:DNA-binding NtrC family response regulator